MTYVSKKEKVFDLPEQDDSSSVSLHQTETKLKRFPSVCDRRAWTTEECQRYQHFYGLVNGSESNISKSSSFKYIPFDVLLAILMAEKDAYIQELLDKQEDNRSSCGGKANLLYKAEGFEDSDDDREALIRKDAEVVSLKNKIAGLQSELEDCRDTLTKAMHKLESMDGILKENSLLKEKIKCSEETIKCLEESKEKLESELQYYRNTYNSAADVEGKQRYMASRIHWDAGDCNSVVRLSSEREILLQQVEELQKELERARSNAAEIEVLRKISETTSSSLEEVSKENECYKRKLESMKCLEKHIEELKKQAHTLTEKYKKESQKANNHLKQINVNAKELQCLREERDKLQVRVNELISYETQYMSLKGKLHQVELIIDENEMLNKKLIQLDRLELENEQLKIRIAELKNAEIHAVEDKERVIQLQCAISDREEEIKKLIRQIEELSQNYADKNEIHTLRNELEEKNEKLRKYEKQLDDIPILESEIDELKNKLQQCIDDFKSDKDLLKSLQEELEAKRCHELEEMVLGQNEKDENLEPVCEQNEEVAKEERQFVEKGENTIEITKEDSKSQSEDIILVDQSTITVDDTANKIKEVEEQNKHLKVEVESLRIKLSKIDLDELILQTNELKNLLNAKDVKIQELISEISRLSIEVESYEAINQNLENDLATLKNKNSLMRTELSLNQDNLKHLKESLESEKKEKEFATELVKALEDKLEEILLRAKDEAKLQKEEASAAKQELFFRFSNEVDELKKINQMSKKLIKELETENDFLIERIKYFELDENKGLKDLVAKLRGEITVLKSLYKPDLEKECEALEKQVKELLKETDELLEEMNELKMALNSEKEAKDSLEKVVQALQEELSKSVNAGNEIIDREMLEKETFMYNLQEELEKVRNDLENSLNETIVLKDEREKLIENSTSLEFEQKQLKENINVLQSRVEELNAIVAVHEEKEKQHISDMKEFEELSTVIKNQNEQLTQLRSFVDDMQEKVKGFEEALKAKEKEVEAANKSLEFSKQEANQLKAEMEILKNILQEKDVTMSDTQDSQGTPNYEADLEEKYALEEALGKIECELDDLKGKMEECKKMEEEMTTLRNKRDSLMVKMAKFENEIETLKKKLSDFENLKNELDQLKADKKAVMSDLEVTNLYQELLEQKTQISALKKENANLKEELNKSEALLEVSKSLKKTIPQNQELYTAEFFTPPALPSPRSEPQDSLSETISIEDHKKDIEDLENLYEIKIQHLKETNTERIKKLLDQHEKEARVQTKAFYDSINSIKYSYETDIRKLVEKHKLSIMRLQGLHEDEVQELNTNYETQMEAMQTQNENVINDLKTETAERLKQLREQHSNEIRELEIKYEEMLKEKTALLREKSKGMLRNVESADDMVQNQSIEGLTTFYQESILELEEKHSRELKSCKKSYLKRIELMKNKYEALLEEERKKYEEQLEKMLTQLKTGQHGDTLENEKVFYQKKHTFTSNSLLEFHGILQKILREGLESLTFKELILVHAKTCFLPLPIEKDAGGGEFSPKYNDGCPHKELMSAEKEKLLKRIFTLEHEIVIKQMETHEAIANMEAAEICWIQELENALSMEQHKNAELKQLLSNQSKQEMDLKIDRYISDRQATLLETNAVEKAKEVEKLRVEKKRLEDEVQKHKSSIKSLSAVLEAEKEKYRGQRKRDAEYVESIRRRLEEALNNEQIMETQLDYELKFSNRLEAELQNLQKSLNFVPCLNSPSVQIETKGVKDVKKQEQSY